MTSFQEKQNIVILIITVGHNTPNNKQETCNMFLRPQLQFFVTLIIEFQRIEGFCILIDIKIIGLQ
jgi:hypothetical protein